MIRAVARGLTPLSIYQDISLLLNREKKPH